MIVQRVVICCLLLGTAPALAFGDDTSVKLASLPAAVRKTISDAAKPAKVDTVTKSTQDGEVSYNVKVSRNGKEYRIYVDDKGVLESISLEVSANVVKLADCPAKVKETLLKESNNGKFDEIDTEVRYGVLIYTGMTQIGGRDYSLVVDVNGTLVEKTLVIAEEDVEWNQCPAAVQHTLRDLAPEAKVTSALRTSGFGIVVYELEVEIGKLQYDVEITHDGVLIDMSLADDGSEEGPADEKKPPLPGLKP